MMSIFSHWESTLRKIAPLFKKMKTIIKYFSLSVLIAVLLDLTILFFSLLQLGVEGRTGEWHPFWRNQAQFIINLIN